MYDEKMIEDSLAFAEEIRARLEGKKTGEASARPVQNGQGSSGKTTQPLSSNRINVQPTDSVSVHRASSQAQPVSHSQPISAVSESQSHPVQQKQVSQAKRSAASQMQPVRVPQSQPGHAEAATAQSRPAQQSVSGHAVSAQQQAGQTGSRQNTHAQGASGQQVRTRQMKMERTVPATGQSRPAQPSMTGQPVAAQSQSRPAQPSMIGQPVAAQGQSRPIQQSVTGQPIAASAQGQSRPVQQSVTGRPVAAQGQSRPVQQSVSGQPVAAPAQGQSRPVQQTVSGQVPSVAASSQQSGLPEGQITRQSMPDQTPIPSAQAKTEGGSQQPELSQAEVPKPEQPKKEHLISVSTSTSRPVRPKSSALETISEETKSMDESQDENHTVEITIKLDVAGIKKKFSDLKKKLAPEERTLEEVNAAMEENRQLQAEKQEKDETAAQKGAQFAHKAILNANGIGKKVTGLLRKKQEDADAREGEAVTAEGEVINSMEGEAVDGQIVQLEGEAVEENRFSEKIQDLREAIPQKAGKASHLLTNVIIIAFCIGIAYFLASFVTNYVAYQTPVEGESMEPTLTDGDSVVIQRLSYYFTDPKRYDVVVFPVHYDSGSTEKTYYIKRVIGLPGETVQIIDGSVYINNEKLTEDKYSSTSINEAGIAENPLVLGENQYFVMGDNRNMSTDSRNSYVGLVNKNDIVGEAWICTWPLNHFGGLK